MTNSFRCLVITYFEKEIQVDVTNLMAKARLETNYFLSHFNCKFALNIVLRLPIYLTTPA